VRLVPAPAVPARSDRGGCTQEGPLPLCTADRAAPPQGKLGQEERQALVAAGKQLKEQLAAAEAAAGAAEQALQREGQRLPNLTHPEARGLPPRSLRQPTRDSGAGAEQGRPGRHTPQRWNGCV